MASEEKRAWIMLVVTLTSYTTYAVIVGGRLRHTPAADVAYVSALLWTVGAAIVASIVLNIVAATFTRRGDGHKDQRDREINRFGEYVGQSFVVIGAVSALLMAMAEWDWFWIANVVYLCFAASAVLASVAKVVAYRRGFQPW